MTSLQKIFRSFVLLVFLSVFFTVQGRDESDYTIELSKKLNEMQMFDYSEYLLQQEIAKNPPDVDLIKVQLAMTYFAMNKADMGEKIIASIPQTSKYYADSMRVVGIEAVKKGKNDIGIKNLEEYFAKIKSEMPTSKSGIDNFKEAIGYLSHVYKQSGNAEKAAEVVGRMAWLKESAGEVKETGGAQSADKREADLLSCQAKLDAIEHQVLAGKTGWETTADSCIKILKELMWINDSIAAFASIEIARAYFFLGRLDDAIKELEDPSRQYSAFDDAFKEEKMLGNAPAPFALFWKAKAYIAKAQKASGNDDKIKSYSAAMKALYTIVDKYDEFFRFQDTANLFLDTKEKLIQLGKTVKFPDSIEEKLQKGGANVPPEAEKYFNDEKFAQAEPLFQEAAVKARKNTKDIPAILAKLAYCYVRNEKPLEALTVASYLAEYFPKFENTPLTLLQVGEYLWNKKQIDDALIVYEDYVRNCPADQYAGAISARIAKVYYDRATEMSKEAEKLPQGQEKLEKTNAAREAFRQAIPKYERIVDNYLQSEHGPQSAYLLAYCKTYAKDLKGGAEMFIRYCEIDSKRKNPNLENIADAKLRTADNYFQLAGNLEKEAKALEEKSRRIISQEKQAPGEQSPLAPTEEKTQTETTDENKSDDPKIAIAEAAKLQKQAKEYYAESIKHLNELLGPWREKGGILENDNSQKTLTSLENATALLGWAYDGSGDKDKACKAFSDFLKKYPKSKQVPVCMFRLGSIYLEMGKPDIAAQILEKLSSDYPQSNEGKQALSSLGRSMYDIGKYDKSIEAFGKILAQNVDINVQTLRWALEKLPDCGGTHPKQGAEIAVKFGEKLLAMLKKPNFADWVGKDNAVALENNPKEAAKTTQILKEKILFDTATASFWAGNFEGTIKYLDELLSNDKTPYYVDGRFLRAEAYRALKRGKDAIRDYSEIGMVGTTSKKYSLYFKAQCLTGTTYAEMEEYQKALGAFHIISVNDPSEKNPDISEEEHNERLKWIEYAIYWDAFANAKLGKEAEKQSLVEKYLKFFPNGKFAQDINKLPTASTTSDNKPKK